MKKILSILGAALLTVMTALGQSPSPGIFNYQGVARNAVGNALINRSITLRLTIHDGSATGPVLYQESRAVTTNPFGLFNVQVGSAGAANVTGSIAALNLGGGSRFIQVEIDPAGGSSFINIGAGQLASVPYSLYSSLANDLVLPFSKTQAEPGTLFKITNSGTGITLHTTGPVRLQGISEAANRILASDATGNASWKDPSAVNIVTGSGTINFIPKWTSTGTTIGNSQIADNGASIGINNAAPSASAQLDISSTTKGILVPRMTTVQRTAIAAPANALLVFDISTNSFWFYNGAAWTELFSAASGWALNGNGGTNPAVHFIGTTDNTNLVFKRHNNRAGFIGTFATSFGLNALNPASTGFDNTAIGVNALSSNSNGIQNTASGANALSANTSGYANSANGASALSSNTSGGNNTANGAFALLSNSTGNANTANGAYALYSNTTGNNNSAYGAYSLSTNTTGSGNTANGWTALNANTTGSDNTASGFAALSANTTGLNNTAHGANALGANTTGGYNTATGKDALRSCTTGGDNTASGNQALGSNTSGSNNTAIGRDALLSNTTGSFNTALGDAALLSTTGSNNIGIGQFAQVPVAAGNNQVRIGNGSITYAGVQVAWTITSDKRWKAGIKNTELGLEFINSLHPVSYYRSNDGAKKTEYGFIAQEVEEALAKAGAINNGIITKDDAGMYGVRYNDLIAPMVKAIQEQQVLIDELQETIGQLKKRLAAIENKLNR